MESVLGRYRNLIILVGVLFLQVLGLAMQVKKTTNALQDTRLIRIWAVGAITPFERSLIWIENSSANLWHNYFYLRGVRAENRELKQQIEDMRLQQVRLQEDAAQAHRLQNLLAFKEQYVSKTVAAQVIGTSGSDMSRTVLIDKGEKAGIQPDMAVMTANGIVGKVLLVYPSAAEVLLISDQSSGVGAILDKSRLQGVLKGTVNGQVVLERVMSDENVNVGETVLTSGGDQIFPKGLPVGTVAKVDRGKDLFLRIEIKPAASLSKLEEVLVLVQKQDRPATTEATTHVRAADILAQRLPSVPDKPADATPAKPGEGPAKPAGAAGTTAAKSTTTAASHPVKTQPGSASVAQDVPPKATTGASTAAVKPKPAGASATTAKPVNNGATAAKTEGAAANPGLPAQNPKTVPAAAPTTQMNPQPPADDNSPH
ncbi:MAG TPA: rod shape-determining protein MreC [Candidatus Sulfotelmatobacter sp.]|nr:rod shape-determining protein MreC [Candidatus Sulfotelmatobacter sp.]HEV3513439.1 rod shape-determining protein MreC [Candidatus Sulfotelmatobacter sp.]